jgi:hypothetical protein
VRERVVRTEVIRLAGRAAILEIEIVEPAPPSAWRLRLARWLIHRAAKLVRMRVRITGPGAVKRDAGGPSEDPARPLLSERTKMR